MLTPREFAALEKVFLDAKLAENQRWLLDRVDRLNAPHFSRKDHQPYTLQDFIHSDAQADNKQSIKDRLDLAREQAFDTRVSAQMKRADFDDSWLPGWARMTLEEKARLKR